MRNAIYETSGRAAEYYSLGCHLYKGCTHGCTYCYNTTAGVAGGMVRKSFYHAGMPEEGYIKQLEADADHYAGTGRRVMLSFTCDPYQPLDTEMHLTRKALLVLKARRFPVAILTKGGYRSMRDFDLLEPTDEYGITLTVGITKALEFEPHSAPPDERVVVLQKAKEAGLRTWVSFEPVLYPAETLKYIEMVAPFTDIIRVGKLNHIAPPEQVSWGEFCWQALKLLKQLNATYYLKKDLTRFIGRPAGIKGGPGW